QDANDRLPRPRYRHRPGHRGSIARRHFEGFLRMRLLILGYSSIVERRVMPAAAKVGAIEEISIVSKSRPRPERWPKQGLFFDDYETGLRSSHCDLVYLSLPNALHERWVM